jgi:two-component system, cell cycle sensor histidine kinase and response regulator CckA
MPQMSGRELAERLAGRRPSLQVLFMSGYTEQAGLRHGVLGEGTAFMQKPFGPDSFLTKVREVLDAAE